MYVSSQRVLELAPLEHSRTAKDAALAEAQDAVTQAVLAAVAEDVAVRYDEAGDNITVTAGLMTLERAEFAALNDLLRAYDKGYSAETLATLVADLAKVFRH